MKFILVLRVLNSEEELPTADLADDLARHHRRAFKKTIQRGDKWR